MVRRRTQKALRFFALSPLIAALLWSACGTDRGLSDAPLVAPLIDLDTGVVERVEEARAHVREAPRDATSWGTLGLVLHANALYDLASQSYEKAEELDPTEPRWPYQRALTHYETGEVELSIAALDRSVALAADEPALHWHRGRVLLELNRLEEADEAFARVIEQAPQRAGGFAGRARVKLFQGDPRGALGFLDRAAALEPRDSFTHHLRSTALRMVGRDTEADQAQALGADGQPNWRFEWDQDKNEHMVMTVAARRTVAKELFDHGRIPEALMVLERLMDELGDDLPHLRFTARAYMRNGRSADAVATYARCLELSPEDRMSLVGMAEAQLRNGDEQPALTTIERAVLLHPRYGAAHHYHGVLLQRAGQLSASAEAFRTCLAHDQRNAPTHLALGRVLLELRQWEAAELSFDQALQTDASLGDAHVGRARSLLQRGDLDGARDALEAAKDISVGDRTAQRKVKEALERARAKARND